MIGVVVFLVVVAMLLVGLVAGLVVMRDIFFEAVERVRSGGPDRSAGNDEQIKPPKGPMASERADADGRIVCEECGKANEPRFNYCKHCTAELR
ncbi:MAG: hypothetical protein V5A55_03640 [Halovenus sp.]